MDQSIFGRLPAELRLQIYHNVFQTTRITVAVVEMHSMTVDQSFRVMNKISPVGNLTTVCRAIRGEALPVMWSRAVVTFTTNPFAYVPLCTIRRRHIVSLNQLRQAIEIYTNVTANRPHITLVNGVKFPHLADGEQEIDLEPLFDYFPNLRSCNAIPIRQGIC